MSEDLLDTLKDENPLWAREALSDLLASLTTEETKAQSKRRREKQAEVWIVQRINELSPSMPKKQAVRQANDEWEAKTVAGS